MNREGLMKIAEEVNANLKPTNPIKINTKSTFETLMGGIKEIVEAFEGKAALSKSTIDFLCEKEVDVPACIKILDKSQKKASVKKAKAEKETSAFGSRMGSQAAYIDSFLSKGKKNIDEEEIAKAFSKKYARDIQGSKIRVHQHIVFLKKEGRL